jgi:hypothetical protein
VLTTVISAAITLIGGLAIRGETVRTVHVISLFFGGVAAGASFAKTVAVARARRVERDEVTPTA